MAKKKTHTHARTHAHTHTHTHTQSFIVRISTIRGLHTEYIQILLLEGSTNTIIIVIISLFLVRDIATYHICDFQIKILNFIPAFAWKSHV
jgi:hypothetical protein